MTIAIIPMLIEALPLVTGAVAGAAACAFFYLKHKQTSAQSTEQKNNQIQTNTSRSTASKQDTPEAVNSAAETIASQIAQPIKEEIKAEHSPVVVETRARLSPEEQALRQQQLEETQKMLIATMSSRPTDSALSRHYDAMITAKAEDCLENVAKMAKLQADYAVCQNAVCTQEGGVSATENCVEVDEEPMLRRHYLHNIRMMLEATSFPRPTDSMLSRHYDEMIDAKADDCLECEAKMARLLADYEEYEKAQLARENPVKPAVTESRCVAVPEDSTLRRHFLTNLRANIEKLKGARPTDSVLRRHYESMINAEVESYLACH